MAKAKEERKTRKQKLGIHVEIGKPGHRNRDNQFEEWNNENSVTGEIFRVAHGYVSVRGLVINDPDKILAYRQVALMLGRTDRSRVYIQSDARGRNKEEFDKLPPAIIEAIGAKCVKKYNEKYDTEYVYDQNISGVREFEEIEVELQDMETVEVEVPA